MNARHYNDDDQYGSGTMTDCGTTPMATGVTPMATGVTPMATGTTPVATSTFANSSTALAKAIGTDPAKVATGKVGTVSSKLAGALIGVGIVALLALSILGIMCWRRRRAAKAATVVASKYDGDGQDRRYFGNRDSMEYGIVESRFVEKPRPVYWK